MRSKVLLLTCAILICLSHDMYLKMDTYFLSAYEDASIKLYNGTFALSENVIDRNRMLDATIVGPGGRVAVDTTQWYEKDSITILQFKTGEPGTYIAGVSTRARNIELPADKFNEYLKHDGVLDMLNEREEKQILDQDAIEKYSKHVKAVFQVGDSLSTHWGTVLGYPVEFVPQSNPYALHTGDSLVVKLLWQGSPLVNQLVYADYEKATHHHSHDGSSHTHDTESQEHISNVHSNTSHEHTEEHEHEHAHDDLKHSHKHDTHEHKHDEQHGDTAEHSHAHEHEGKTHEHQHNTHKHAHNSSENEPHTHTKGQKLRTDNEGNVTLNLTDDGLWYLRTIYMQNRSEEGLTHESNWATLTFEVKHTHKENSEHSHTHEEGIPTYVFVIGSVLIILLLFFLFNRKKKRNE